MNTYTKTMNQEEIKKLETKLINAEAEKRKTPPYALFQYKTSECTITAYTSGKVVFQGKEAEFYNNEIAPKTTSAKKYPEYGSDEVGTGDYFGPVVVCAVQVLEKDLTLLHSLKIADSKQLSDEQIEKIAPVLIENLVFSSLILNNEKYNEVHKTHNMNAIKAKLHNQAFLHLEKKTKRRGIFMELDTDFCKVFCCEIPEVKKAVIPVECSMILPDYFPDVMKILRYTAKTVKSPKE